MSGKVVEVADQHPFETFIFNEHCDIEPNMNGHSSLHKPSKDLEEGDNKSEVFSTTKKSAYLKITLEISALWFWVASGILFIITGHKNDDILTMVGSAVWVIGCFMWLSTYLMK